MIAAGEKSLAPNPAGLSKAAPPLENGDHLTAREFMRRYEAMPQVRKAELIEGIVYMGSPVRADVHGTPDLLLQGWIFTYLTATPGVTAMGNSTLKLDVDNVAQPDAALRILETAGGQSKMVDGYIVGAPELIVEIAASSVSIDLHDKMQAYRRNGAREYLVWRTLDAQLDWFALRDGQYQRLPPSAEGLCQSAVFPGLALDVNALLRGDAAGILAGLQKGLANPAHAEFVAKLKAGKP
jgi:Uma2 family endonuclease